MNIKSFKFKLWINLIILLVLIGIISTVILIKVLNNKKMQNLNKSKKNNFKNSGLMIYINLDLHYFEKKLDYNDFVNLMPYFKQNNINNIIIKSNYIFNNITSITKHYTNLKYIIINANKNSINVCLKVSYYNLINLNYTYLILTLNIFEIYIDEYPKLTPITLLNMKKKPFYLILKKFNVKLNLVNNNNFNFDKHKIKLINNIFYKTLFVNFFYKNNYYFLQNTKLILPRKKNNIL